MRLSKVLNYLVPVIAVAGVGVSVAFATQGVTICDANYCTGQFACPANESSCCCKQKLPAGGYGPYACKCTTHACDGKDVGGTICQ